MARQLQLPLFQFPRSHEEAMRRLLAARALRCELASRVELVDACHPPLLLLAGVPIGVRNDPPAALPDARWAEYNRRFNDLLMRQQSG